MRIALRRITNPPSTREPNRSLGRQIDGTEVEVMPPALDDEPYRYSNISYHNHGSIPTTLRETTPTAKPTKFLSPSPSPKYSHTVHRDADFSTKKRKANSIVDLESDEIAHGSVASNKYIIGSGPSRCAKAYSSINGESLGLHRSIQTAKAPGNSAGRAESRTIHDVQDSPHSSRKMSSSAFDNRARLQSDQHAVIAPPSTRIDSDSESVVMVPAGTDIRTTIQIVVPQYKPRPMIAPSINVRSGIPIDLTSGIDFPKYKKSTKSNSTIHKHKRTMNPTLKPGSKRQEHIKSRERKPRDPGSSGSEDELAGSGGGLMRHSGRQKANQERTAIKCPVSEIFTKSKSFMGLECLEPWTLCQFKNDGVVEVYDQDNFLFKGLKFAPEDIELIQRLPQTGKLIIQMKPGKGFSKQTQDKETRDKQTRVFLQLPVLDNSHTPMADKAMMMSDRLSQHNPGIILIQSKKQWLDDRFRGLKERLIEKQFLKQQNNAESTPGNPQAAAHVDKLERSGRGIRDPRHSKVQNSAEHNVHSSTDDEFSSEVEKLSSCSRNGENGATLEHENSHNANLTRVNRSSGEQSISDRSTPRSYRTERARGIPKTVDNDFIMKEMADTEISNENRWSQLHPEWSDQWKETIFYQGKDNAKATVQKDDVERLDEGVFLNDNLIEFYLRWLENRLEQQNPEIAKRIYLHNTFFFKRLTQNGKGRAINYNAVERWTNKVDLLSFDYIIVPVHENTHWYVAVICNAASLLHAPSDTSEQPTLGKSNPRLRNEPSIIEILDSQDSVQELDGVMDLDGDAKFGSLSHISLHAPVSTVDPSLDRMNLDTDSESPPKKSEATMSRLIDTTQTRILTLDSMGGRHSPTCTKLRDYLVEEITAKKGVRISPPAALGLTVRNLPRQQNDYDCGIFLLNYVEEFLNDPDGFYRKVLEGQSLDVTFRDASETRAILRNIILSMQR